MPIEFDPDHGFSPAREPPRPVVEVRELLAVDEVHLNSAAATSAALRRFYTRILGFDSVSNEPLRFKFGRRHITLNPPGDTVEFARLELTVNQFGAMLKSLAEEKIPYELLHIDTGLNRAALIQDPAGNWIHLLETRPL